MENSLSSFRRALAEGYRYIETDVQATSDGVVVISHDDSLDRTTDQTGRIAELPWSFVCQARIGGREPISRLADVLEELPDALLNIDVKADNAVGPIIAALHRMNAWHRVCLASFSDRRLARLRRLAGDRLLTSMGPRSVAALWAYGRLPLLPTHRLVAGQFAQVPRRQGPLTVVDPKFIAAAHRHNLEVHVWTVDAEQDMVALLDLGVDGLVTDRPDILREVLRNRSVWVS